MPMPPAPPARSESRHRYRRALLTVIIAATLDLVAGTVFALVEHFPLGLGLYWAVTTATTVGYGDVVPHTGAGHVLAVLVMLTIIPLFAATFSLLTSGLTATHVQHHAAKTHRMLQHIIDHHPDIPELSPTEAPTPSTASPPPP
jgi:hypothetical protein